ncbi:hypothetical protein BDAP_002112, partial [Binucleata daphniae]
VDLEIVPSINTYEITDKTELIKRIQIIKYIKKANFQVLLAIYKTEYKNYKILQDYKFYTDYYYSSKLKKEKLLGDDIIEKLMSETELVVQKVKELNDRQDVKSYNFLNLFCCSLFW